MHAHTHRHTHTHTHRHTTPCKLFAAIRYAKLRIPPKKTNEHTNLRDPGAHLTAADDHDVFNDRVSDGRRGEAPGDLVAEESHVVVVVCGELLLQTVCLSVGRSVCQWVEVQYPHHVISSPSTSDTHRYIINILLLLKVLYVRIKCILSSITIRN